MISIGKWFLLLLFCLLHFQVKAWQQAAATETSKKAAYLYSYGDSIAIYDTAKGLQLIRQGMSLVGKHSFELGLGYYYLGRVLMDYSNERARVVFDSALYHFQSIKSATSYTYQSRVWANIALMSQLSGDNRTYIELELTQVIPLSARAGDSLRMADGYASVALPFMNFQEYDKATYYLKRSLAIFGRLAPKDPRQIDGYVYLAQIALFQDSVSLAGQYIDLAAKLMALNPGSIYAPNFHGVESMYLIRVGDWQAAATTIEKGLVVAYQRKNRYEIRMLLYQRAQLFKARSDWSSAKAALLSMLDSGYIELDTDKKQVFKDLSDIERHLNRFEAAYSWMVRYDSVNRAVYEQQTRAQISDLEAKYNYAQKEKELQLISEKTKKQRLIFWFAVSGFLIAFIGLYLWFRNKKLRDQSALQELKQNRRIELGRALLEGEERERSRMARDLHDGLGGILAGLKLNLSQKMKMKESLDGTDLAPTLTGLGHSVSELRRIARNMMPASLLQSGLTVALKDLCDETSRMGIEVNFISFDMQENYPAQVQVMVYRIIQELVHNAVKHAQATKIMVQCTQTDNVLFITVEDNGVGFDKHTKKDGMGLSNIRSRVGILNGSLEIDSSSEGTNINIELYVG